MEVKIEKDSEKEFEFMVSKDAATLMNLVRVYLLEDKDIEMVTYKREHPLLENTHLYIKGKKPKHALESVVKNILKDAKEAKKAF